jgi:hypothetical protein
MQSLALQWFVAHFAPQSSDSRFFCRPRSPQNALYLVGIADPQDEEQTADRTIEGPAFAPAADRLATPTWTLAKTRWEKQSVIAMAVAEDLTAHRAEKHKA